MGRKIFAEKDYYVLDNKVVPYEQFQLCVDQKDGFTIRDEFIPQIIELAEALLGKEYPMLKASEYRNFVRNGNRDIYQGKYYMRREDILILAVAEAVERKGRFTDQLVDLLWMILEETTWIIPAHNFMFRTKEDVRTVIDLPVNYDQKEYFIDLFSATTAGDLAVVYYLCKDILDEVNPVLNKRLLYELERRIIKPFLTPEFHQQMVNWSGVAGNKVINWNPWILSNILLVCALTVKDYYTREAVIRTAIPMLDRFPSFYAPEGGCEEGPSYWSAAGASFFDALQLLYDMTDGYIDLFQDPLVKNIGEYVIRMIVHGERVLNFGDSPAKVTPNYLLLYRWGVLSGSDFMKSYGADKLQGKLPPVKQFMYEQYHPYRLLRGLASEKTEVCSFKVPLKFWQADLAIAGTREYEQTDKGLYLAFKGGYSQVSHGHRDIGSVIVFADGKPIFLDAGKGTYTKRTFSSERQTIWAVRSDHHNVITVNGMVQVSGPEHYSRDHIYEPDSGKCTMNLKHVYPEEAGIEAYTRSALLADGMVTVEDNISLKEPGNIMFSFICDSQPEAVTEQSFVLHGHTITFDESLEYACEALDRSWPETETLPAQWDVEVLYRITLKNIKPVKEHTYVLTVR